MISMEIKRSMQHMLHAIATFVDVKAYLKTGPLGSPCLVKYTMPLQTWVDDYALNLQSVPVYAVLPMTYFLLEPWASWVNVLVPTHVHKPGKGSKIEFPLFFWHFKNSATIQDCWRGSWRSYHNARFLHTCGLRRKAHNSCAWRAPRLERGESTKRESLPGNFINSRSMPITNRTGNIGPKPRLKMSFQSLSPDEEVEILISERCFACSCSLLWVTKAYCAMIQRISLHIDKQKTHLLQENIRLNL